MKEKIFQKILKIFEIFPKSQKKYAVEAPVAAANFRIQIASDRLFPPQKNWNAPQTEFLMENWVLERIVVKCEGF